ncbi:MAG: ABC transporter permease [Oligoflexia bacterium]|nr:ABC transporter permease [Oligoflexia bacterium]
MISLALKYLVSRKRQSLFTLLGIFLGAAGYVTISGFFVGFQRYIIDQLVNSSAHVFIQYRQDLLETHSLDEAFFGSDMGHVFWSARPSGREDYARIENPMSWYDRLDSDPRVAAYSPQMTVAGLLSKSRASASVTLTGCIPEKQSKVNDLASKIVEGSFSDIGSGGNRIVVGRELQRQLGVELSQNINVTVGSGTPTPFKVVGIYESGNRNSDLQAFGALADVQKLDNAANRINEIDVKLKDYNQAGEVARNWSKMSPEKIESWDTRNSNFFSIINLQTLMRYVIVGVVMLVAGFGIYNVLMMTVNQKMKDVAILQAIGYQAKDILFLFLFQGLLLGVSGALSGILVGYLVCRYLQTLTMAGPPGSTTSEHLHIALNFGIYSQAAVLAIAASIFASFLPSRAASKLTPIEIIRGGVE